MAGKGNRAPPIPTKIQVENAKPLERIPDALRKAVWAEFIGPEEGAGICYCCGREKILQASFECGHIQSKARGGMITLDNLRPVSRTCNASTGAENMAVFAKQCGFHNSPILKEIGDIKEAPICATGDNNDSPTPSGPGDAKCRDGGIPVSKHIVDVVAKTSGDIAQISKKEYMPSRKGVNCRVCGKHFRDKFVLNRHKERKIPCVAPTAHRSAVQCQINNDAPSANGKKEHNCEVAQRDSEIPSVENLLKQISEHEEAIKILVAQLKCQTSISQPGEHSITSSLKIQIPLNSSTDSIPETK